MEEQTDFTKKEDGESRIFSVTVRGCLAAILTLTVCGLAASSHEIKEPIYSAFLFVIGSYLPRPHGRPLPGKAKLPLLALAVTCLALTGCSRLVSHQVRVESDGAQSESWQRITTFWDSKSSVAKLRASNGERSQGLTLTDVGQESASTNVNALVSEAVGAAVRAAVKP